MDQIDYRAHPSHGGETVPSGVDSRDVPNAPPAAAVPPPPDRGIQSYDLPSEPAHYNQMGLGLEIPTPGWSRDLYAVTNPDVNPRGRR
ncbi:MAG TPA: hypothetical protein VFB58_13725 [Chloroflexota bacterium]|nr:hypothetical protein [Chloroflexota bacterium]